MNPTKKDKLLNVLTDSKKILLAGLKLTKYVYKNSPVYFSLMIVTLTLLALIPFLGSWINSKIIDYLVATISNTSSTSLGKEYIFNHLNQISGLLIAVVLTRVVSSFSSTISSISNINLWFKVGRELTFDVTQKFSQLDDQHFENPAIRDQLNKVKENYGSRPQQFMNEGLWAFNSIINIVAAAIIIAGLSPMLIIVLVLTSFPDFVTDLIFGKKSWGIWNQKGDKRRDFFNTRYYLINQKALMELRIFKLREWFLKRMIGLFDKFQDEQIKQENRRAYYRLALGFIRIAGSIFVLLYIIYKTLTKSISIGQFNFYTTTANRLNTSIGDLLRRISSLYEHGLYVVDIFDFFELENEIHSGQVNIEPKDTPPTIEFVHVDFKYPLTNNYVLKDFNLKINPGEHIAIVGENGAGKTTIIKLLLRFYDVTSGAILINGTDIKDISLNSLYTSIGTLFQEFNFYHFTAKENIQVGNIEEKSNMKAIIRAAKESGAHEFIKNYDNKYDQILSKQFEDGIEPSYGQKQKIALARAFYENPPVLVLDEPTSAIDPKSEFEIFEKLYDFAKNKTVIIISHRFSTVRNAEKIVVLDKGKIIESGTHIDLIKIKNGVYKKAFELQKRGYE